MGSEMCIRDSNNAVVLLDSSSGPVEEMVREEGATDVAERMGLFEMEAGEFVKRRKYSYGTHRVNGWVDVDGSFDEIHIQEL